MSILSKLFSTPEPPTPEEIRRFVDAQNVAWWQNNQEQQAKLDKLAKEVKQALEEERRAT
jgi:hypothetical protein